MPIHDWTRVEAGVFHDFHGTWIAELRQAMNRGVLPQDYYAQIEQHTDGQIPDVLTLHQSAPVGKPPLPTGNQVVAVLERPPSLSRHALASRKVKTQRQPKFLSVRHVSGHRVVANLEIVSPGNKDRRSHVRDFVAKIRTAIRHRVHAAFVDLFPPTSASPDGLPEQVWRTFGKNLEPMPVDRQRCVVSYIAKHQPESWAEYLGVGIELPDLPLFLSEEHYIRLPLAETYAATFAGSPQYVRERLSLPTTGV